MDPKTAAQLLALGRTGMGFLLLAAPERIVTPWVGPAGATTAGRLLGRVIGVRDLVVGLGQLNALARGGDARPWIVAGATCDAVDFVATWQSRDELPTLGVAAVTVLGAGGAAAGAWLQSAVD